MRVELVGGPCDGRICGVPDESTRLNIPMFAVATVETGPKQAWSPGLGIYSPSTALKHRGKWLWRGEVSRQ